MATDTQAFISLARLVYQTAVGTPALALALAGYGYPAERMNQLLERVRTAADAQHAVDTAQANAKQATMQRETAILELERWVLRLTTAARLAARKRPDLRALMG